MAKTCIRCNKVFSRPATLKRHLIEVHKVSEPEFSKKFNKKCLEPGCDSFTCHKMKDLIQHLQCTHLMNFETVFLTMENMNEFTNWKKKMELENNCSYVFNTKYTTPVGDEISYYNCNRSNKMSYPKRSDNRKRSFKKQGSGKMSSSCTSQIKLIKEYHKFRVEWQKVHYGHGTELEHIRIPKIEKEKIAMQLLNGVSVERILESYRDNIDIQNLKRVDLLTPKDIRNIKVSYGIQLKDAKEPNDASFEDPDEEKCEKLEDNMDSSYAEDNMDSSYAEDNMNSSYEEDNMNSSYEDQEEDHQLLTPSENKLNEIKMMAVKLANTDLNHLDEAAIDKIYMRLSTVNSLIESPTFVDTQISKTTKAKGVVLKRPIETKKQKRFILLTKKRILEEMSEQNPFNKDVMAKQELDNHS